MSIGDGGYFPPRSLIARLDYKNKKMKRKFVTMKCRVDFILIQNAARLHLNYVYFYFYSSSISLLKSSAGHMSPLLELFANSRVGQCDLVSAVGVDDTQEDAVAYFLVFRPYSSPTSSTGRERLVLFKTDNIRHFYSR